MRNKSLFIFLLFIGCLKNKVKLESSHFKGLNATQRLLIDLMYLNGNSSKKYKISTRNKIKPILEGNLNIINEELIQSIAYRDLDDTIIKLIIEFIDRKYINLLDKKDENLLHVLAAQNNLVLIENLIENFLKRGLDINSRNVTGETALMIASQRGYKEVAKILIKKGANLNMQEYVSEYTALHWAVYKREYEIKELLIAEGADTRIQDMNKRTPLQVKPFPSITKTKGFVINRVDE